MTDTEFQKVILEKMISLEGKIDTLEAGQKSLEAGQQEIQEALSRFRSNQEDYNNAMWKLMHQAFHDISDIRAEMLPSGRSIKK